MTTSRLERALIALIDGCNVSGDGTMVVPGEYLEVVIVNQGRTH